MLLYLTTLGVPASASAAGPAPSVTEQDIRRAQATQPKISDADLDRARRGNRMPTDAELARVPVPAMPNIDALPVPAGPGAKSIDLEALARGYDQAAAAAVADARFASGPRLLIFLSFSMPEPTLKRLVEQADRVRATLVLRGLVSGSLVKTVSRARTLIGSRQVGFQIDPQAFDRYGVQVVPTFVLAQAGATEASCGSGTCEPGTNFVSVAGDVSVPYALEHILRSAPAFQKAASDLLLRVQVRQ